MGIICTISTIIVLIYLAKIYKEYKRQLVMYNKGKCRKCGSDLKHTGNLKGRVYSCGSHYMTYVTFITIDKKFKDIKLYKK